MSGTWEEFEAAIDEEHLEEATFLFEQISVLRHDPEVAWFELESFEQRAAAHVDALVLAGTRADVLLAEAASGDLGARRTALEVRADRARADSPTPSGVDDPPDWNEALESLDPEESEAVEFWAESIVSVFLGIGRDSRRRGSLPRPWRDTLVATWAEGSEVGRQVLARVTGELGWTDLLTPFVNDWEELSEPTRIETARALGRLDAGVELKLLGFVFESGSSSTVRRELALAMLASTDASCRDRVAPELLSAWESGESWPALPLALGSLSAESRGSALGAGMDGPTLRAQLRDRVHSENADTALWLALGVAGDAETIDLLLRRLERLDPGAEPAVEVAIAASLELLTGAGLWEQVVVFEKIDPDTLLPEELERFERGESPESEEGETITRPLREASAWRGWWEENRRRFNRDCGYRCGVADPESSQEGVERILEEGAVAALSLPTLPHAVRVLLEPEFAIRIGRSRGFSATLPVAAQRAALR